MHPQLGFSLVFCLLFASCATIPPPAPSLPFGEFIDQVLDPLSSKIADERIEHAKAELKAGQVSPLMASMLGFALGPIAGGVTALNNASIEQQTAKLDAQRLPLKQELLALFTKRTFQDEEVYRVCVEGAERRYGVQESKFVRLVDGSGPCERSPLKTLAKGGTD